MMLVVFYVGALGLIYNYEFLLSLYYGNRAQILIPQEEASVENVMDSMLIKSKDGTYVPYESIENEFVEIISNARLVMLEDGTYGMSQKLTKLPAIPVLGAFASMIEAKSIINVQRFEMPSIPEVSINLLENYYKYPGFYKQLEVMKFWSPDKFDILLGSTVSGSLSRCFVNVPDDALHNIAPYLNMKEITRLTMTSAWLKAKAKIENATTLEVVKESQIVEEISQHESKSLAITASFEKEATHSPKPAEVNEFLEGGKYIEDDGAPMLGEGLDVNDVNID